MYETRNFMNWCIYFSEVHTIAAIKAAESYENLSIGFKNVFEDINNIVDNPHIMVLGKEYKLLFFLSSDYKVTIYIYIYIYIYSYSYKIIYIYIYIYI